MYFFLRLLGTGLLAACLFFCSIPSKAQYSNDICGTTQMHQKLINLNPNFLEQQISADKTIYKQTIANQSLQNAKEDNNLSIYTIPVVIHVLHNPGDALNQKTNIPDNQILNGIEYLNSAYRNTGFYNPSTGVDTKIEFCLASRDPNGQSTTGINRYANASFVNFDMATQDEDLKLNIGWNRNNYLNIWIVNEICNSSSTDANKCKTAAYSFLAAEAGKQHDGIVIESDYFGIDPDDTKVLIHEVGHYLNLYHTFEGGCPNNSCLTQGDKVCDTPPDGSQALVSCASTTNSCNTDDDDNDFNNPFRSTNIGGIGNQNDMTNNYMDYNYKSCQNAFTQGQKERMRITIETLRSSLLSSQGCYSVYANDAGITEISSPKIITCSSNLQFEISVRNYGSNALNSFKINYTINNGQNTYSYNWTNAPILQGNDLNITVNTPITLTNGNYTLNATLTDTNGNIDQYTANNTAYTTFGYVNEIMLPVSDNFDNALLSNKWIVINPDNSKTWASKAGTNCNKNGTKCLYMNNFNYSSGISQSDYLITRPNMQQIDNAKLIFDIAYRPYNNSFSDRLKVIVSKDCGKTFTELYNKAGFELATVQTGIATSWQPSSCNEWRTDTVDLSVLTGENAIIAIINECNFGNNLYLDNVKISGTALQPCTSPTAVSVNNITEQTAKITWSNPTNSETFEIRYKQSNQDETQWISINNISNPYTLNNLTLATNYDLQVRCSSCKGGYSSEFSALKNFTTSSNDCPFPNSLLVSNVTDNSAKIAWGNPPGTSPIGFNVQYKQQNSTNWQAINTNSLSATLYGLQHSSVYEVQVQTICNNNSNSFWSVSKQFQTEKICEVPTNVNLTYVTCDKAIINWVKAAENLSFQLQYKKQNETNYQTVYVGSSPYILNGLENNELYECQISASCGGKNSILTDAISFKATSYCENPSNLVALNINNTSATLGWLASEEASEFNLRYREKGSPFWQPTLNANSPSLIISNLLPCTEYEFAVKSSCNQCSTQSDYTLPQTFKTQCISGTLCSSTALNADAEWIKKVKFANLNNTSNNNNGYADFTNKTINVIKGQTYQLSATVQFALKKYHPYWRVWIDYNNNNIYEVSEKVLETGEPLGGIIYNLNPIVSSNVTIPTSAITGKVKMRVSLKRNAYPAACETFDFGEVEDYLITISDQ